VRALKPSTVLEVGTNEGASATHLLAALDANGAGELISLDTNPAAGGSVPDGLRERWVMRYEDAKTADLPAVDFVFEDGDHSLDGATAVLTKLKALNPRVLVSHDYAMTTAFGDFHVKEAFDTLFPDGVAITLDGCERGLALWVNPDWSAEVAAPEPPKPAPARKPTPARKPAAKRTRTARK
jgi:hypothetical protein